MVSTGSWESESLCLEGVGFGSHQALLPGDTRRGWGSLRNPASHGSLSPLAPAHAGLSLLQTEGALLGFSFLPWPHVPRGCPCLGWGDEGVRHVKGAHPLGRAPGEGTPRASAGLTPRPPARGLGFPLTCPLGGWCPPLPADTGFPTPPSSSAPSRQLFESLQVGDYPLPLSRPAAAYEEALQLVKEGKVPCRTLR